MTALYEKLKTVPHLPGIYKMLNHKGEILYIGKSKDLNNRIHSYFSKSPKKIKIVRMMLLVKDFSYVITATHLEACLLECRLIKLIQPPYNAQFKNDHRYVYLKLNTNPEQVPLSITSSRDENCFGPFRSQLSMNNFIDNISHLFPILIENNNNLLITYHLFPDKLERQEFMKNRETLLSVLTNRSKMDQFITALSEEMYRASHELHYERAKLFKDIIKSLHSMSRLLFDLNKLMSYDLVLCIPVDKRFRLLLIQKGMITAERCLSKFSKDAITKFFKQNAARPKTETYSEKAALDFYNIILNELQSFPAEWIHIMEKNP
ncbi:GIY-YIG nuclease family protein [Eubacteriaceae bacterium ES2]|nr:GIY-YIG nuclease family protein [Eubacteriaceae bacterium ES2]